MAGRGAGRSFGLAFAPRDPEHAYRLLTTEPERGRREAGAGQSYRRSGWAGREAHVHFGGQHRVRRRRTRGGQRQGLVRSVETHAGQPAWLLFYPWGAVIQLFEARER